MAGVGFGSRWLRRRSAAKQSAQLETFQTEAGVERGRDRPDQPTFQAQLQQARLAYAMASEISQFKAGFLARTSHELRSPLNGMIGLHQLILSDLCDSPEEEREFVTQAHQSALKLIKLLDEVLEVSRLEHGNSQLAIQPVSLQQLLAELESLTRLQAANRNLKLKIQQPDLDVYVLADPIRLRQVLLYLVDGAIAQTNEGLIQVSTSSDADTAQVFIWLDFPQTFAAQSEPLSLAEAAPDQGTQALSPGMNLFISCTLIELMHGQLEPVTLPTALTPTFSQRLQCSLPLATED